MQPFLGNLANRLNHLTPQLIAHSPALCMPLLPVDTGAQEAMETEEVIVVEVCIVVPAVASVEEVVLATVVASILTLPEKEADSTSFLARIRKVISHLQSSAITVVKKAISSESVGISRGIKPMKTTVNSRLIATSQPQTLQIRGRKLIFFSPYGTRNVTIFFIISTSDDHSWFADSGSSQHMADRRSSLRDFVPVEPGGRSRELATLSWMSRELAVST